MAAAEVNQNVRYEPDESAPNHITVGLGVQARVITLPAVVIDALDEARRYRNRLMHFEDPLTPTETKPLTDFCDMVRQIQL